MRLSGWVRAGIVATAIWSIWSFQYQRDILTEAARTESKTNPAYTWCWNDKFGKGEAFSDTDGGWDCFAIERRIFNERTQHLLRDATVATILPVVWVWLGVFLAIGAFRWVRAGFEVKPEISS